jgi:hypothetical protein
MKSNLHSMFATNSDKEKDGEWCDLTPETGFLVARMGGANAEKVKKLGAFKFKPHAKKIREGKLAQEKENAVMAEIFVDVCLKDWKGVEDLEGNNIPFSRENAIEFLTELPELLGHLTEFASDVDNYKEDLGNF